MPKTLLSSFKLILFLAVLWMWSPFVQAQEPTPPIYSYRVINTYPHDPDAFTQGLIYQDDIFYEGTGLRGRSSLRKVEVETGHVQQIIPLDDRYFGEGITIWDERIIQITWQSQTGFIYDKDSFENLGQFSYPTEGWGITHDGEKLIMSDGSATLYFWDPDTLEEIGHINVYDNVGPVERLNELEYIKGEIFANIWQANVIARIDPQTGEVLGYIDLRGLLQLPPDYNKSVDVLNGIAYDEATDRLFITGKLWPYLYEIELIPPYTPEPTPTPPSDLQRGLVAHYPFNGQAEDSTANENDAIVHGAALTTDRFGRPHSAYQFDGQADYLEIPHTDSLNVTTQVGLSLWLLPSPATADSSPLIAKGAFGDGPARYGLWLSQGRPMFCLMFAAQQCLTAETALTPETWHHIAADYDGQTLRLFHNNQLVAEQTISAASIATSPNALMIAAEPSFNHYTTAQLDDIRLYNRALTVAEIGQLYQQIQIYLPVIIKS